MDKEAGKSVYQRVTDKIIEALKQGVVPWVKQWSGARSANRLPYNLVSQKKYRGVNMLLLLMAGMEYGYGSSAFLSFNQAKSLGGCVRKGEAGHMVVLYRPIYMDGPDRSTAKYLTEKQVKERKEKGLPFYEHGLLARSFTVFNVEQCDGIDEAALTAADDATSLTSAKELLDAAGAETDWGVDPHYSPSADRIGMPTLANVLAGGTPAEEAEGVLYACATHELTHWTGAKSRLDRLPAAFAEGDKGYAKEELVAELGSAFLCARAGISGNLQHAAYIGNWLTELGNDNKFIFQAAADAQRALDFIDECIAANGQSQALSA